MGYYRETTPNIDKMARKGLNFKNAISPAPRTLSSMVGIFTGKLMSTYVKADCEAEFWKRNARLNLRSRKTLAEVLSSKGYTTGAFCPNAYTSSYFGFNKGFDYFQDFLWSSSKSHQKVFERMIRGSKLFRYLRNVKNLLLKQEAFKSWESYYEDIINWVNQAKKPFFLWIFLLDTHLPWIIPRKYRKWGTFLDMYYSAWKIFRLLDKQNSYISEKLRNRLINAYDDSIYYADQFIGKLHKDLKDYDPIFVIHSDHGEEFGERGFYGHNYPHLYEENIHVPLVISNLDEKEEIKEPISLLKLPEIVLNLTINGRLSDILSKSDDWVIAKDFDYSTRKDVIAVRIKDWKFIRGQNDVDELYNLSHDPDEQINLIDKHPKLAEIMRKISKIFQTKREERGKFWRR